MSGDIFRSYKNVGTAVLKDAANNIIVLPTPSEATIEPGVELAEVLTTNAIGEQVRAKRYVQSRDPRLNLTFGNKTPDLIGLNAGQRFELQATQNSFVQRSFFPVPQSGTIAAATAGQYGNGVAADAAAQAAYVDDNGQSVQLTRGAFAGFDPAVSLLEFAVGADGALVFGNSLQGRNVIVQIPNSFTNVLALGDAVWGQLSMQLVVIEDNGNVVLFTFSKVSPDPTPNIVLNEPQIEVPFFIDLAASDCRPYDIEYLGQVQFCGN